MIAAWMLYTFAVTVLLLAAAGAAEYVARAMRAPTRLIWAAAMIASIALSARGLLGGLETRRESPAPRTPVTVVQFDASRAGASMPAPAVRVEPALPARSERVLSAVRSTILAVRSVADGIDVGPLERWNAPLLVLWMCASLIALSWLAGSLIGLRRMERRLVAATVDDHAVLVSKDVGPALFGVVHSRIVLPEWVLALSKSERRVILAHEEQHATAFDPALVYGAALLVALQPWNVALWVLFTRLRLALEGDCDRRVLGEAGDARQYGRLLVAVYERKVSGLTPYVAFVERPSNLERRIRRLTRRPRLMSMAAAASAIGAAVLVTTAWTAAAPVRRAAALTRVAPVETTRIQQFTTKQASREVDSSRVSRAKDSQVATEPRVDTLVSPPIGSFKDSAAASIEAVMGEGLPPTTGRRCNIFGHYVSQIAAAWPKEPDKWSWIPGACSIYGDIVVVAVDSARVIVATRDTSDVWSTAFLVFATKPGSISPSLVWSTTTGRAELTDTAFYYDAGRPGMKMVGFRLRDAGVASRKADAQRFDVTNLIFMQMRGIPWEVIAQLPVSARCTAAERDDPTIKDVGLSRPAPKDGDGMDRACFMVSGQRFAIPIP